MLKDLSDQKITYFAVGRNDHRKSDLRVIDPYNKGSPKDMLIELPSSVLCSVEKQVRPSDNDNGQVQRDQAQLLTMSIPEKSPSPTCSNS